MGCELGSFGTCSGPPSFPTEEDEGRQVASLLAIHVQRRLHSAIEVHVVCSD